jgi:hypothetical protein
LVVILCPVLKARSPESTLLVLYGQPFFVGRGLAQKLDIEKLYNFGVMMLRVGAFR